MSKRIIVIGAGIGGLTAAAVLAKAGLSVTVLEAHVYPGGCAGTFYHQKYRFDAGATLAGGFYPGGPMDITAKMTGVHTWPTSPLDPAMVVHLPDGTQVQRFGDDRRHAEHRRVFGDEALSFWRWQEKTADAMWDLALRLPDWPPQTPRQVAGLFNHGISWMSHGIGRFLDPGLLLDAFRPASVHLKGFPNSLSTFVNAQLLISAQTTSQFTNAAYAASALDLPRRGVVHLRGGIGAISEELVRSIKASGGQVLYRKEVSRIIRENQRNIAVETRKGESYEADLVIANLTPSNIRGLLVKNADGLYKKFPEEPIAGWGAFMVYVGLDGSVLPQDFPSHHQVIKREPLGEGRSIFLSISPAWDETRAPHGQRAITISTHTQFAPWWDLYKNDRLGYESARQSYTERIMKLAGRVIPNILDASQLILPGTPVTFERFTRRHRGWVGGFPQKNLFQNWGARIAPDLWMVGDSIFPGQSIAAVSMGGVRVAQEILRSLN